MRMRKNQKKTIQRSSDHWSEEQEQEWKAWKANQTFERQQGQEKERSF